LNDRHFGVFGKQAVTGVNEYPAGRSFGVDAEIHLSAKLRRFGIRADGHAGLSASLRLTVDLAFQARARAFDVSRGRR
jgi:hypothetical protein